MRPGGVGMLSSAVPIVVFPQPDSPTTPKVLALAKVEGELVHCLHHTLAGEVVQLKVA